MPAMIIPGRSKGLIGIKGKNSIIHMNKSIESTKARVMTDGIIITVNAAIVIIATYAAIYPPMLVTCLPFIVIVVPVKKWIIDISNNMPITMNSIFFFFIVITSVCILRKARVFLWL
jgi:hypothetical protein